MYNSATRRSDGARQRDMDKKQVVVIGLGRFGASLARSLYNLGHDVLAIDSNSERIQGMMGHVTYPVAGNATNDVVLRELGVPDYDTAVVAIGADIPSSIMACVILKTMGIGYIVARANNELHGVTLERIGVDKVIHPESEGGDQAGAQPVQPEHAGVFGDDSQFRYQPDEGAQASSSTRR